MDAAPPSLAAFCSGHALLYPPARVWATPRAMATQPAKGGVGGRDSFQETKPPLVRRARCRSGPNRDMVGGPAWVPAPHWEMKGFLYCVRDAPALPPETRRQMTTAGCTLGSLSTTPQTLLLEPEETRVFLILLLALAVGPGTQLSASLSLKWPIHDTGRMTVSIVEAMIWRLEP